MSFWQISGSAGFEDLENIYGFRITQQPGMGMAPVNNISSTYGLLDGALFQRTHTEAKQFTLIGTLRGTSVANLHTRRKSLISVIAPDRSGSPGNPVILRYTGGATTLQASAFYRSGLELGNVRARTEANIAFSFDQFDPYWEKTTNSSATLTTQASFTANYIAQRAACGSWGTLGSGMNATVISITSSSEGDLIIGGEFTTASGGTANYIVKWNNGFSNIGAATALNNTVWDTAVGLDGFIYAAGLFSTASVAAAAAARYSGTGWLAMSTGLTGGGGLGTTCIRDPDGNILFGGTFTAAGGTAACGIAKWTVSSSAWSAISNGLRNTAVARNGEVYNIAIRQNKDIMVVGFFDHAGSTTGDSACRVALYSQSSSAWAAVGGSGVGAVLPDAFFGVDEALDTTIYIGTGEVVEACRMYTTNGVNLTGFGPTLNSVYTIDVEKSSGFVYFGGFVSSVKGVPVHRAGRIIGNTPAPLDIKFPGNSIIRDIHSASDGVQTIGFNGAGTASAAGVTVITNNGTAQTYPILTASAPTTTSAQLVQLVNYTTKDAIYFNLTLQPREIVTLDLRPGVKTLTSNFRGNIINTITPGSNVATWRLLPGNNNVSFFLTSGGGAAKLSWTERFWSIDN